MSMIFVAHIQMDILEAYYMIFHSSEVLISTFTNNSTHKIQFYRKMCD